MAISKIINGLTEVALAITNFFKPTIQSVIEDIKSLVEWLKSAWEWLKKVADKMSLSGIASGVLGGIKGAISTSSLFTPMADGGIVTRPTTALIGEAGAEAVIPLSKKNALGGITVNINGGTYLSEDVAEKMGDMIIKRLRFDFPV